MDYGHCRFSESSDKFNHEVVESVEDKMAD